VRAMLADPDRWKALPEQVSDWLRMQQEKSVLPGRRDQSQEPARQRRGQGDPQQVHGTEERPERRQELHVPGPHPAEGEEGEEQSQAQPGAEKTPSQTAKAPAPRVERESKTQAGEDHQIGNAAPLQIGDASGSGEEDDG